MNSDKIPAEERERFLIFMQEYPFFRDGELDLFAFSVYFSNALWMDDIKAPEPNSTADLFIKSVIEAVPNDNNAMRELIIQNMDESQRNIYPCKHHSKPAYICRRIN